MRRDEVIQSYLNLFHEPNYLEIGVLQGETFHRIQAANKIAVDPKFEIEPDRREPMSDYIELTSDQYFDCIARNARLFDVIYLDGLHTFEQTLRDLMNAINFLRRDGVIVIDDIMPTSYHSSLPDPEEAVAIRTAIQSTDYNWMGDVYRLVHFIQSFLPRFDYATVADNHGQIVMWRGTRDAGLFVERRVEDIARLEFRQILLQRQAFNILPNAEIVRRVRHSMLDG